MVLLGVEGGTPWSRGWYSLEYRGYSLEYSLHAEMSEIFGLYQFSPTKNQNIEKILSDSEP